MKKDTLINLRINQQLKEDFQAIVEREGFTMSEILEASMIDIVNRNIIPINIRSKIGRRSPAISIPFIKKCLDETLEKMKNNNIVSISLFGSYAKGNANANSDIDLFVDVDNGFSLFDIADLQIELESALGKKVDLVTKKDDEYFINHIQKEKIQLYERVAFQEKYSNHTVIKKA